MKHVILSLLLGAGVIANAGEVQVSVGPDQLNCNTISAIETFKHISVVKGAGPKRLSIQDMNITSKVGQPKSYTMTSYLPNNEGDSVLEATEVSAAIGTIVNGVELVFEQKNDFKSGKLTFIKQTPKGTIRDKNWYQFSCN